MNPRFQKLIAAANVMIGRCQMSRKLGLLKRAHLQWKAAERLQRLATL